MYKRQLRQWRLRAQEDAGPSGERYRDFAAEFERAQGECAVQLVTRIQEAIEGDIETVDEVTRGPDGEITRSRHVRRKRPSPGEARWLLARRFPEDYARRDKVEHGGEVVVKRLVVDGLPKVEHR